MVVVVVPQCSLPIERSLPYSASWESGWDRSAQKDCRITLGTCQRVAGWGEEGRTCTC